MDREDTDGKIDGARCSFRRVTRDDFALLARWLAEPHVARWWNHDFTAEAVEADFGASADGDEPSEDHLALLDGQPVGLIQFCYFRDYPEYAEELEPFLSVPPGAVSIDYLIGEPSLIRRGVGRAVLTQFIDRVWTEHADASCVVVPVASANVASWKLLLAVGFRCIGRCVLTPDNPIDDGWHEVLRLDRA